MATSVSSGGRRSTRREPPTMGKQLVNFIKPFHQVPGPKGLPIIGTLFDYFKKDGLRFSKMFEVSKTNQH
jgi:hypothetical protein